MGWFSRNKPTRVQMFALGVLGGVAGAGYVGYRGVAMTASAIYARRQAIGTTISVGYKTYKIYKRVQYARDLYSDLQSRENPMVQSNTQRTSRGRVSRQSRRRAYWEKI